MKLYSHWRMVLILVVCSAAFLKWNQLQKSEDLESARLAQCPVITDVSHRPLGEQDFSGRPEKVESNGQQDLFMSNREGIVRVGVREKWGASLVFFGESSKNTLDDSTPGSGLHLKFHSAKLLANQPGNSCGVGSRLDAWESSPFSATISFLNFSCMRDSPSLSSLRVNQTLRFVRENILEIEYAITNLGEEIELDSQTQFPAIYGATNLNVLKNSLGKTLSASDREPTNQALTGQQGWASMSSADDATGVAIYWENKQPKPRAADSAHGNLLLSNYAFTLPARDTALSRIYLVHGGFSKARGEIQKLDRELPPFGRIDANVVNEDTRSVSVRGWALDNKMVTALELWVDGKKYSDLKLNTQRPDICATYPGYQMCEKARVTVGFEGTYTRPAGEGCPRPVEVRARDDDGNWRAIARTSIAPVLN